MGSGVVAVLVGVLLVLGCGEAGEAPEAYAAAGETAPTDAADRAAGANCILERTARISWAADVDGLPRRADPATDCETEDKKETGPLQVWNFRSGPVCDAGSAEIGRAPSDRICEARDVPVRGKDTCVFNGEETRCTWWGFEFDYANANPDVPITCVWTRSRPVDEGNYEGVRKHSVATDTTDLKLEAASGHYFFSGFDTFPVGFPHPWYTVDMEYDCSYPGTGRVFLTEYRLIFSSAFD